MTDRRGSMGRLTRDGLQAPKKVVNKHALDKLQDLASAVKRPTRDGVQDLVNNMIKLILDEARIAKKPTHEVQDLKNAVNKLAPDEMQVLAKAVMKLTLDEPRNNAAVCDGPARISHKPHHHRTPSVTDAANSTGKVTYGLPKDQSSYSSSSPPFPDGDDDDEEDQKGDDGSDTDTDLYACEESKISAQARRYGRGYRVGGKNRRISSGPSSQTRQRRIHYSIGFTISKSSRSGDIIPSYLNARTQKDLRAKMWTPPSHGDGPGYIYVCEIRDPNRPDVIQLKVGSTNDIYRRMKEWATCFKGQQLEIRGWWPKSIKEGASERIRIPIRRVLNIGRTGEFRRKLEGLVHLELKDLACNEQYLSRDFPHVAPPTRYFLRTSLVTKDCSCGKRHTEIFTFKRIKTGPNKGREWENIVLPVIRRWGTFVERAASGDTSNS